MEKVRHRIELRVASAYKTISLRAIQVITGTVPIHLQVDERKRLHRTGNEQSDESKMRERHISIETCQNEWETNTEMELLIPNIRRWMSCKHRKIDYFVTQILTGHGSLETYTKRFHISEEDCCIYCRKTDTAAYTFFHCPRWINYRNEAYIELGEQLSVENSASVTMRDTNS
ncbi:hypothetical protein JTB14_002683 [Gonioctena quinquepunctata]|nr:hypothetical protein JTB14_002683 [Gonioctena quinquepunctata]